MSNRPQGEPYHATPPDQSTDMAMGATVAEMRHSPRYPLHAELDIRTEQGIVPAFVTDVSREGMFVATRERFALGQSFQARLHLAKPLMVKCVVARVVARRGVGVRFVLD